MTFESCCNFLTNKESCSIYSIDVALKNFSISSLTTKRNLRINFASPAQYEKLLPYFFKLLVETSKSASLVFKSERQISKATKNLRLEYFMRGILKTLNTSKQKIIYSEFFAKHKKIAAQKLGWEYEKIKSTKKFKSLIGEGAPLNLLVKDWSCAFFDIKTKKFEVFEELTQQKKFDDFVDTLLILVGKDEAKNRELTGGNPTEKTSAEHGV